MDNFTEAERSLSEVERSLSEAEMPFGSASREFRDFAAAQQQTTENGQRATDLPAGAKAEEGNRFTRRS